MDTEEKRAYNQRYYKEHKRDLQTQRNDYHAGRRERLRALFEKHLEGKACQRCGINDIRVLDIRYAEHPGHLNLRNTAISQNWSVGRIKQELNKSIILCLNCQYLARLEESSDETGDEPDTHSEH
jgi:hypothetical protein